MSDLDLIHQDKLGRNPFSEIMFGVDARYRYVEYSDMLIKHAYHAEALRSDVVEYRSADWLIWPSVFKINDVGITPNFISREQIDLPRDLKKNSLNFPLWSSLKQLVDWTSEHCIGDRPYVIIGLTSDPNNSCWPENLWPNTSIHLTDASLILSKIHLGYDVVDCGFFSALYGWSHGNAANLDMTRNKWGSKLNKFHLFSEMNEAERFAIESNSLIPEHAPFFVCGIYELTSIQ